MVCKKEYRIKGISPVQETLRVYHLAFLNRKEIAIVLCRSIFNDLASQVLVKIDDISNWNLAKRWACGKGERTVWD